MKNIGSSKFLLSLSLGLGLLGWMVAASSIKFSSPASSSNSAQAQRSGETPDSRLTEARAPDFDQEDGEGSRRANWFYAQRAYPLKAIPRAARLRALEQLEREGTRLKRLGTAASDMSSARADAVAQPVWTALGPAPIAQGQTLGNLRAAVSGRVSTVVLDPGYNGTSNQTVYLGAAQGGVWRSRDNGATWTPLTDDQPSLAMGAIAIDPTNPNIIYLGTGEAHSTGDTYYGAGLLKSTDGGATWIQITGPISTTDPKLPAFLNATFHALAIDPTKTSTIYAATEAGSVASASGYTGDPPLSGRGIWKSTDGGLTWRKLDPTNSPLTDRGGTDVLIDPQNPERVFATLWGLGIYRSTNGGEAGSWERLAVGLPGSGFGRIKLAVGPPLQPAPSLTLYAALAATNDNLLGIYKSTDQGTTWAKVTTPQLLGQANYNLALAVDPVDANIIYYGTSANNINVAGTFWRSKDGGQTWTDLSAGSGTSGGLHADTHWITVSPAARDILFTANDGGVWRTDSATAEVVAWTNLNQALNITQFQTIALHPTDPNILLGGTQDNGTNRYDGNPSWFHSRDGDGGFTLIDQSNPQVMYHTFFNQKYADGQRPRIGPELSLNGGNTWSNRGCSGCTAQPGGFNPADRVAFYAPMAQHTGFTGASGNVIYFGTHRLYRSADQAGTWTGLGANSDGFGVDLTKNSQVFSDGFPSFISAIAAHPVLDQNTNPPGEVVWVGTGDGLVQFTTNAGALANATFTNTTKAPLPNRYVTDIALDPVNQQRAIVTYSGFNTSTPTTPGHVFLTTDQGATWTDISGNLPDVPVNSIALDPTIPGTFYIGTDLGAFQTTNSGATWIRLSNGLPQVAVFMLRYHAATKSLVAATHGRGVYRLTPAAPGLTASFHSASFAAGLAKEAIATAFGNGLATTSAPATSLPLPTTLGGTQVIVKDSAGVERLASLFFVSSGQVNYLIPSGTASGTATVAIVSGDGAVSTGTIQVGTVAPGLYTASSSGSGVAAAIAVHAKTDGTQTSELIANPDGTSRPIDLGPSGEVVVLLLYGTGIRNRSNLSAVTASIGGVSFTLDAAKFEYAGPAPGFVGLDQVNVQVPRSLIGRGEVDLVLTVDGKAANTVKLTVR